MALKRITEVTIISSSDVTETPHTFIEHDGAFYRIDSENFQKAFLGGVFRDLEAIIAEDFSTSSTYDVGDLAIYDNKLYECTTAIATAGSWDSTKWTELDLATKITTDKSLALRNRPADAKTVGDAIASIALTVVDPNNDGHLELVPLADEWSDEFLEDSVVEATENWLEEHVSSGNIVVDNTLSISGAAADSKVTGDNITELKEDLTDIANTYLLNGWPAGEITVGAFYSTDGNYVENANWSCVSDYFKVEQNVEYTAKTFTTDGRIIDPTYCVCFYDNSKAFIYGYLNQTQITAPNNAKYARLSVMNNYKTGFIFTDNYNAQYYPFGYRTSLNENIYDPHFELLKKSNPLYGKILCTVGDSITQGADMDADGIVATPAIETYQYNMSTEKWDAVTSQALATYGYQIAERNNMKFYNGGISGSVVAGLVARDGFSLANGRYTKLPDDIDYLTIWFGWNDYAAITDNEGETLGALYSTDITTFYGAWNTVLSYLINKYPYTKICLCVPYGANGDIRDAVRTVANYWGVAYWDNLQAGTPLYFNKEYGVTVKEEALTHNRSIFQANGAHPNYKGHKQLADMLEHFLKGI